MNCVHLSLNIDPLKNKNIFTKTRHTKISIDDINTELLEFFESMGLKIHLSEIFYSHPYYISPIHTDTLPGDFTKLNWQFGGTGSKMCWYSSLNSREKDISKTSIGTNFVSYSSNEVELIESNNIKFPSLVQAGIPHNIKNDYEDRWVLSIVFKKKIDDKRPTMSESISLFKNLIVNED